MHMFDRVCGEDGIEHRLTKPNHPWTNGQVERMNRTLKEATVKRYHYESHDQLRTHLQLFLDAYTTPAGSRPCVASRPTNTSRRSGRKNRIASDSIRHTHPGTLNLR